MVWSPQLRTGWSESHRRGHGRLNQLHPDQEMQVLSLWVGGSHPSCRQHLQFLPRPDSWGPWAPWVSHVTEQDPSQVSLHSFFLFYVEEDLRPPAQTTPSSPECLPHLALSSCAQAQATSPESTVGWSFQNHLIIFSLWWSHCLRGQSPLSLSLSGALCAPASRASFLPSPHLGSSIASDACCCLVSRPLPLLGSLPESPLLHGLQQCLTLLGPAEMLPLGTGVGVGGVFLDSPRAAWDPRTLSTLRCHPGRN